MKKPIPHAPGNAFKQQGITLIVAMLMLLILSATAAMTIRGSASSEQISNNARSQELAWQLAEAALRYCETGARNQYTLTNTTATLVISEPQHTLTIAASPAIGVTPSWMTSSNWDTTPTVSIQVPLYKLDDPSTNAAVAGTTSASSKYQGVYKRAPDCIVQYATNKVIWVTARGFGPEVGSGGTLPFGAEVFLQATLDFN
jgi:type IV pilus assembly protein PilX